jgi:hypothetical protein
MALALFQVKCSRKSNDIGGTGSDPHFCPYATFGNIALCVPGPRLCLAAGTQLQCLLHRFEIILRVVEVTVRQFMLIVVDIAQNPLRQRLTCHLARRIEFDGLFQMLGWVIAPHKAQPEVGLSSVERDLALLPQGRNDEPVSEWMWDYDAEIVKPPTTLQQPARESQTLVKRPRTGSV